MSGTIGALLTLPNVVFGVGEVSVGGMSLAGVEIPTPANTTGGVPID